MASYETGYDDERFQHPVGQSFHCGICYNVIKDPVMCRHNEHMFCRGCITRHLMNSQTCPTCIEPLTVDTLTRASRTVTNLLSELKIHCEFFNRGCERFVELGELERHVVDCGFAPAVCSNEGCGQEVDKQDLLHHETAVCEFRRVKCHSCNELSQEMDIVKENLAVMNLKLNEVSETLKQNEMKLDRNEKSVLANADMVQKQLNKQEESNRRLEADNVEMKKCLEKVAQQMERLTQQREDLKKSIAEAVEPEREPKIIVAGGYNRKSLNSVEMFSLSNAKWLPLQPMKQPRNFASSVVYNNQMLVSGGFSNGKVVKSTEKSTLKDVHVNQSIFWEDDPAVLRGPLYGHSSVVYNGRLIVIGGYDGTAFTPANITEISLVPPYTSKVLVTLSESRWLHGAVLFGNTIVILGGKKGWDSSNLKSVLSYDIVKNECRHLAPLPYPVNRMATVKWGDDKVILIGGSENGNKLLNKVLIYNIKTQKSHMLPDMKYKRRGCAAAVVGDTVVVIGGYDENGNSLKSVESFRFDSFTWEELPEMQEARYGATTVVC
ncbi:kelch-like ECH-associated protein 1 [Dendronephthya gigantea]|uniref:kelch-like ECH-associated protein 1 n=1 Tax=Dendronephthya gigantea TaxID=151771 RepID=UPI00106A625D|nr:kelch-like ECH-associated protein 1 [Dendronephthya gigantea]XP_028411872.1 kelch-like ECH-associated protein 1 [Dendronephthya gigantea]